MNLKKPAATIALTLFALSLLASAQTKHATATPTPAPAAATLPSQIDLEAAMTRTLGYDPNLSWEVVSIQPSVISGLVDVTVVMNKQQTVHLHFSPDKQLALVGDVIPFGPNPFADIRAKLRAADGPVMGSPTPAILLVEFSDLECPHCKAAQPIVEKLIADFPQVRYIFQQFPLPVSLHPWAAKAADYADCAGRAGNDGFWKFVDSVFENQDSLTADNADAKFKDLATAAGLGADKLAACAATKETEARVQKSLDLGRSVGVDSTPTVFINGRKVPAIASVPYDQLKQLVQFEIDHADK